MVQPSSKRLVTEAAATATYGRVRTGSSSAQRTLKKIKRDVSDVEIVALGDSTTSDLSGGLQISKRWFHLLADALAPTMPEKTVVYHAWDEPGNAYDTGTFPAVTIQAGTGTANAGGPFTVHFYNGGIPGSVGVGVLGVGTGGTVRYGPIVANLQPDLIIGNFGKNDAVPTAQALDMVWEQITLDCPDASIILIAQSPTQGSTFMAVGASVLEVFCERRGYGFIDVHQMFVDAGTPGTWYADTVHPSYLGSQMWAAEVQSHFAYSAGIEPRPRQFSSLELEAESLLPNSDFTNLLGFGFVRSDWVLVGGAVWAQDYTNTEYVYATGGSSAKLTAPVANAAQYIQGTVIIPPTFRGKWVTLGVRMFVPVGASATAGQVSIQDGTGQTLQAPLSAARGTFAWYTVRLRISATATSVVVKIWAEASAANPLTTGYVTIDRVSLCLGTRLKDIPRRRQSTFLTDLVVGQSKKWRHPEWPNDTQGVSTLVAGTVTVATTSAKTGDRIRLTGQDAGAGAATWGELTVTALTNATSFVITSSLATDTRKVLWEIIGVG